MSVFIRASVGAQMGGCAFLLWALDALAPMMDVVLRCMQSPVCQLKEDVSIIEPYIQETTIYLQLTAGCAIVSLPPPPAVRKSYS